MKDLAPLPGIDRTPSGDIAPSHDSDAASYLAAVVASSDDAIVTKDLEGIVTSWNVGAERIFGYSAAEMVGRSIRTIIPQEQQAEEDEVLRKVRSGNRVDHFETIRVRKDGTLVPISLTVSPVKDQSGRIIGASKVARDISERRRAEEAIQRSIELKDQFLGLVSHELRTPISTIVGNGKMLLKHHEALDEEERTQALEDVVAEGERLHRIIENLLILTRLEAGLLDRVPIDLTEMTREIVDAYARRVDDRIFDLHTAQAGLNAWGDPTLVRLILENLLSNADKYSPRDHPVRISIEQDEHQRPRIVVTDEGIGISEADKEKIFEPFYRAQAASSGIPGMGLGLSVCRRAVQAMDGEITCESLVGKGSAFGITLLRAD